MFLPHNLELLFPSDKMSPYVSSTQTVMSLPSVYGTWDKSMLLLTNAWSIDKRLKNGKYNLPYLHLSDKSRVLIYWNIISTCALPKFLENIDFIKYGWFKQQQCSTVWYQIQTWEAFLEIVKTIFWLKDEINQNLKS